MRGLSGEKLVFFFSFPSVSDIKVPIGGPGTKLGSKRNESMAALHLESQRRAPNMVISSHANNKAAWAKKKGGGCSNKWGSRVPLTEIG